MYVGWLRAKVFPVGRAVEAQENAHGREEIRVPRVQPPLHAFRPPRQTREETHQGAGASAGASASTVARWRPARGALSAPP